MNWVDLVIVLTFGLYVWDGYRRGFLKLSWELVSIILAFILGLKFYPFLSDVLASAFNLAEIYSKPIAFLSIWFGAQIVFYFVGRLLAFYTPVSLKESPINHYLGFIPAALKGIIFIAVLLILFIVLPISGYLRNTINSSFLGGALVRTTAKIESQIENVFNAGSGDLTSFTNINNLDESATLNFSTTKISIDENSENVMLHLINSEREKAGLKPLESDILVRNVARAQSRDMLIKGYFSHNSLDGENLFDRLTLAHVSFTSAAENIALAPSIELAHMGLMNSPKHKENILDPNFTKVGIGVIDAGAYGLMITQDFIN
ncbi:hypothetical protein A2V71_01610 [Candidatus Berkelbacteria bacterium RBG_13_40_8]|uniref:SCP domain-containing protein n=1 Tax=Candidatus Berkelbacteria bacterium RBG_13_40_8 TaxID=1797467 RepID=A0A1F5DPP5_9BACT|nr:MAG: hypothetical protein A2V71_01610 [Candidatus Berkelbacteria bacterium RBG_13_40_8]